MKFDLGIIPLIISKWHSGFSMSILSAQYTLNDEIRQFGIGFDIYINSLDDRDRLMLRFRLYGLNVTIALKDYLMDEYLKCPECGDFLTIGCEWQCRCAACDPVFVYRKP